MKQANIFRLHIARWPQSSFLTLINSIIYLQLFLPVLFGENICRKGNPVTDDIKDIDKLIGNFPRDYSIQINLFPKVTNANESCWLYLTVPEMSVSLDILMEKFANNSSNYLIIEKLQRIMRGIYSCLDAAIKAMEEMDYDCENSNRKPTDYFNYFREIVDTFQRADKNCPCDSEAVCRRLDPPTPGRDSNSSAHVLEQSNKTRVSKCERTHLELARPGRAKRHILTASTATEIPGQEDPSGRIEGVECPTSEEYFVVVISTILFTVFLFVTLWTLAVRLKQRKTTRENQSQQTGEQLEERREENELQTHFMCEHTQSMT